MVVMLLMLLLVVVLILTVTADMIPQFKTLTRYRGLRCKNADPAQWTNRRKWVPTPLTVLPTVLPKSLVLMLALIPVMTSTMQFFHD